MSMMKNLENLSIDDSHFWELIGRICEELPRQSYMVVALIYWILADLEQEQDPFNTFFDNIFLKAMKYDDSSGAQE